MYEYAQFFDIIDKLFKGILMSMATKGLINESFWEGALSRWSTATKSHSAVYSAVHDMFQSFGTFIQVEIIYSLTFCLL